MGKNRELSRFPASGLRFGALPALPRLALRLRQPPARRNSRTPFTTDSINISAFHGRTPVIHESAFIDASARVIGDVVVGQGVSVWPMAVIRADEAGTVIGNGSAILDLSLVESPEGAPVTVGDGSIISHGAIIHGADIRSGTLIGAGAVVLDRAVVGEGSIVAAGTVVSPRTAIPPNSLVLGSPGRVLRETTPEERDGIRRQADALLRKSRMYLAEQ